MVLCLWNIFFFRLVPLINSLCCKQKKLLYPGNWEHYQWSRSSYWSEEQEKKNLFLLLFFAKEKNGTVKMYVCKTWKGVSSIRRQVAEWKRNDHLSLCIRHNVMIIILFSFFFFSTSSSSSSFSSDQIISKRRAPRSFCLQDARWTCSRFLEKTLLFWCSFSHPFFLDNEHLRVYQSWHVSCRKEMEWTSTHLFLVCILLI